MENTNDISLKKEKDLESNKKAGKKKHGFWYYFLNILLWGIIAAGIIYSGLNVIDQKTGYTFLPSHNAVIVSDSMSFVNEENLSYLDNNCEHIYRYDVVTSTNYSSYEDVKKLDVVLYMGEDNVLVCHRVVDKYENNGIKYIVTRGDANNVDDTPFNYNLLRGKVTKITRGAGHVVLFFQSPYFLLALCFGGFFILLGCFIAGLNGEKKNKQVIENAGNGKATEEKSVTDTKPIEDNETAKNKPDKVFKYKCPKCGGIVEYKIGETASICPKCGTSVRRKLRLEEKGNEENK